MNNKEQGFIGGAAVHKELQGFAAFLAYQSCHQDGGSITKAMIEASIGLKYFGNPNDADSIGLAEQLVSGVGVFASLYERSDTFGTDPRLRTQASLLMKPALHCLGSHVDIPVGGPQGITIPLLFQSKLWNGKRSKKNPTGRTAFQDQQQDDRIKARTLLTRAQEITKNGKKALACVMSKHSPYRDYARTGNLPSGMVHDDYLQYVREKMYVVLNPDDEAAVAIVDNHGDTTGHVDNILDTTPPAGLLLEIEEQPAAPQASTPGKMFTFPGYIVFALLGPIVENDSMLCYRSDLLMSSAPVYSTLVEKRTAGRAHRRKVDADANRKHRRHSDDSYDDDSSRLTRTTTGTSEQDTSSPHPSLQPSAAATLSECIQAAGIAQSRIADKGKKKAKVNDRKIAMYLKKVAGKQSMIQETKYLIESTAHDDPNRQVFLLELRKLNLELAAAIDELTFAEEQIIEHELADASTVGNMDTMIDATITSILTNATGNNNTNKEQLIVDRMMSPLPAPFQDSNLG